MVRRFVLVSLLGALLLTGLLALAISAWLTLLLLLLPLTVLALRDVTQRRRAGSQS